jgi:PHS family inorganic phosphate transporter-like MFS transporter
VLSEVYTNPPQQASDKSLVASTALWGAVAGQLFFGSVADYIGRKRVFLITPSLVILGAVLSAFCVDSATFTIYQQLALYRFILGACLRTP